MTFIKSAREKGPSKTGTGRLLRFRFFILVALFCQAWFFGGTAEPVFAAASISVSQYGSGWQDATNRIMYVDLSLSNVGDQTAMETAVTGVVPRSPVTYNSTLSPAYPILYGNIAAAGKITRRVYLNVPAGTVSIILTVNGQLKNSAGLKYSFSSGIKFSPPPPPDLTPPAISITPQNNSIINQSRPQIVVTYSDSGSGIDTNTFSAEINGVNSANLFTVTNTQAVYQPTSDLPSGNNTIKAGIKDIAGNAANAISSFVVDTTPPEISNLTPADGSTVTSGKPVISASFSDAISGIDVSSVKILLDGQDITASAQVLETGFSYTPPQDLSNKTYSLSIDVKDKAGNNAHTPLSFTIARTQLAITIDTLVSHTNQSALTVTGTYTGDNIASIKVNGVDATINQVNKTYSAGITLSEGNNAISAIMTDTASHTAEAQAAIVLDTVLPTINVEGVTNDSLVNSDVTPMITVTDDHLDTYTITLNNASFQSGTKITAEGNYVLQVDAKDKAGNTSAKTVRFAIDKTLPEISNLTPADGSTVSSGKPVISASFSDAISGIDVSSVKIMLDGQDITASSQVLETGFSYTPAQDLSNKTYSLSIDVKDKAGNNASKPLSFTIARTQLAITIGPLVSPTNHSALTVTGTYAGDNIASIKVNGVDATINQVNKTYSAGITLSEGNNPISAVVTDASAHTAEAQAAIVLDTAPPTINVEGVTNDSLGNSDVTPVITVTDDYMGSYTIKLNNADFQSGTKITAEGSYVLQVDAQDKAGNTSAKTVKFAIDKTPPEISNLTPADGSTVSSGKPTISGSFSDAISGTDVSSVKILLDGQDITASSQVLETGFSYTPPQDLSNKTYSLSIDVKDKAGNNAHTPLSFTIARTQLAITIDTLVSHTNQSALTVTGTYTGDNIASIKVNGVDATINQVNKTYSAGITLSEGNNAISAVITDTSAHTAEAQAAIVLDTAPPAITITSPLNNVLLKQKLITVQGTVNEVSTVTINGIQAIVTNNTFTVQNVSLEGRENIIKAVALDQAGNRGESQITVLYNATPPQIQITYPQDNASLNSTSISVSGNVNDPAAVVTVNGVAAVNNAGQFSVNNVPLQQGENFLTARAVDTAGNAGQHVIKVTCDTIAPVVKINTPSGGAAFRTHAIDVFGTIDDTSAGVTVNGVIASVDAQGKTFTAKGITLQEGDNTITVIAADSLGNQGRDSLTVRLDTVAPAVRITSPADGYLTKNSSLEISGTVDDPDARLSVKIGNTSFTAALDQAALTFRSTVTLQEGSNIVTVHAADALGNTSSAAITIILDSIAPVIGITQPANNYLTRQNLIRVEGTVSDANTVTVKVNDVAATISGGKFIVDSVPLSEGENTLTATAKDTAGNQASASVKVVLDITPPAAPTIEPPAQFVNLDRISVKGTAEPGSTVIISGGASDVSFTANAADAAQPGAFSGQIFLNLNQVNKLQVTVRDKAGNTSAPLSVNVTQDNILPQITVTSPKEGSVLPSASTVVAGVVSDVNGIASLTVNGSAVTPAQDGSFEYPLDLGGQGSHQITVACQDPAQNKSSKIVNVTVKIESVDTSPPVICINSPLDKAFINRGELTVSGTISDASQIAEIKVLVDNVDSGVTLPPNPGSFTANKVNLSGEGQHTLTVSAKDDKGNEGFSSIQVTLDTFAPNKPSINVVNPPSPTNAVGVTLFGTCEANSKVKAEVNGESSAIQADATASGNFTLAVTLNKNTENIIKVNCEDKAGNPSTTTEVKVVQDALAPAVTSCQPTDNQLNVPLDSKITLIFSEPVKPDTLDGNISLKRANQETITAAVSVGSQPQTVLITPAAALPDGQVITVNVTTGVTDLAGNNLAQAFTSRFTTIDVTGPAAPVLDTFPSASKENSVVLTGTAEPLSKVVAEKDSQSVAETQAGQDGKFSLQLSLTANSDNAFSILAIDAANNRGTPTAIHIIQDSQSPQVTITPQNGASDVAYDAKVVFTFNEAIDSATIPQQNSPSGNVRVFTAQGAIAGSFGLSSDKKTVTFSPANNFSDSSEITALATTGIKDFAGNALAQEVKSVFTVKDTVAPASPVIKEVVPQSPTKAASVVIKGTAELQSQVGRLDGGAVKEWVDVDAGGAFSVTVPLVSNQSNLIRLVARDRALNIGPAAEVTVVSDTLPPSVTKVVPSSSATGVAVDSPVTLTFSEALNTAIAEANIKLTDNNNQQVNGKFIFSANDSVATFDPDGNLTTGTEYTVSVGSAVTDKAGNDMVAGFSSKFTTSGNSPNAAPPKPLVTQVVPESPTKETEVTLKGSAFANTTISVTGGAKIATAAADANGDFTVKVSLNTNQTNTLLVIAGNTNGASPPDTVIVVQDSLGPEIQIRSPENNAVLNSNSIPVCGTVTDINSVKEVKLNNVPLTVDRENFATNLTLSEGDNTITVNAVDGLGNISSKSLTVKFVKEERDVTPPVVTITQPLPGAVVGSSINVKGTVVDAGAIQDLKVNGVYCPLESGIFDAVITLSGGQQTINAEAIDAQGFKGTDSVQVTVDDTPPAKPQLENVPASTTAASIAVKGTTDPDVMVSVNNAGTISKAKSDASGGFSITVALLENKMNDLAVTAQDAVGNKSDAVTVQIMQDSTPLGVMSITPASGATMVEANSLIKIEFTKPVSEASLKTAGNFKVTSVLNGKKEIVAGNITLTPEGTVACFTPFADFLQGAEILVDLSTDIVCSQDASQHLASAFSANFVIIPPLTSVSGMVLSSDMTPLKDATVSIEDAHLKTTVAANGGFLITRVPEGIQDLVIDGSTSTLSQKFGRMVVRINVVSGRENTLNHPVFLTPINEKSIEPVATDQDKVMTFNDQVPGFSLDVKAGSTTFPDGKTNGAMSATLIEPNNYPGRLPDGSMPEVLIELEPRGTTFSTAAGLTFPNKSGLQPGTEVVIFHFSDGLHNYEEIGKGIVSQDGQTIVCSGALKSFSFIGYKLENPLGSTRYLKGVVKDQAGQGIPGVSVNALAGDQQIVTDETGSYSIPLPAGALSQVKVFATVCASIAGSESQKVVYSSAAVNPQDIGGTLVNDIVVDSFALGGGLRLVDKQGVMITNAAPTAFDAKGNLSAISLDDLKQIQLMIYRKNSGGQFNSQPVIVISPSVSAQSSRENIRFLEHIFNGPTGIEIPGEKSPVRIEPGELLRVVAYSARTGYTGIKDIAAPKQGQSGTVACDMTLYPPDVQMKVERLFYANNERFTKIIPHGGTSLITDQLVLITTTWKAGGKPLPSVEQLKLYGRLMTAQDKGLTRRQEKDLRFTIPGGESVRVLEIRGSFPDSQAIIDVTNFPGDEYLELSPERTFLAESILPLSVAGDTGQYLPDIRRFNFHISSDTEAQAINVWGISASPPDEEGFITVTGGSGSVEGKSLVTVTNLSTGGAVTVTAADDGSFTARILGSVGDIIQVVAQDTSGNLSQPRILEVRKIPQITAITPSSANRGEQVEITGRNFSSVAAENEVRFHSAALGGVIAPVVSASSTKLIMTVPQQASTGLVTITVNGETSPGYMFTVTEPLITKLEPLSGTPGQSLNVTILGENTRFSAAGTTQVSFGPFVNVESFSVDSSTQITCQIKIRDDAPINLYPVSVTTDSNALSAPTGFSIDYPNIAPVITKIEPEPGTPGQQVVITGSNFLLDILSNKVYFNDQPVRVMDATSTQLTVTIPYDYRGGAVSVKVGDMISNALPYNVTNLGVLDTITPGETKEGEIKIPCISDKYTFTADAGTVVNISLERKDNLGGQGSFNPLVTLLDPDKEMVAWDDDSGSNTPPGPGNNALLKGVTLPKTGEYTIIVDASKGYKDINEVVYVQDGEVVVDNSKLCGLGPYKLTLSQ